MKNLEVSDKQIELLLEAMDVYIDEINNDLDKEQADVYQRLYTLRPKNTRCGSDYILTKMLYRYEKGIRDDKITNS